MIADIHFNHTLALKAIEAGAHCVRLNPGNIGGPEKVAEVIELAKRTGTPLRVGVNSGSLPKHLRELEYENPVEALVTAALETVELMERLRLRELQGVDEVHVGARTRSPPTGMLAERIPYPLHLGVTEAGTKWSGSLKSAVGLGTLLADGIGDTIRISLSTFHAEEEVKVAWEILKALKLREKRPGADRLSDLWAPAVRHGHCGRRSGARAWKPTRTRSRSRCSAARSTASARRATRTSASRAPRTWA